MSHQIISATNHVKSTTIFEVFDRIVSELDVFSIVDTSRSSQESEELTMLMFFLDIVVNTNDHIVTTGSLSSG